MILPPHETARFYRIWFSLLRYVNEQCRLIAHFPDDPDAEGLAVADAGVLRDALWADDALRERFVADNPAGLPPADLDLVVSWQFRLAGRFFVERYLKKYTIFLSETTPMHAYGVLGLVSPIEDIVGPYLPVYVQTVLLPFDGRIIYDSLIAPYNVIFGPGIRGDLKAAYRDAQEREGIITNLMAAAPASPDTLRRDVRARNAKVLAAFRKDLLRSGLSPKTADEHAGTIGALAESYLLAQDPPRGLLDLSRSDLHDYLTTAGKMANRVSFKRFVRFLSRTGRLDYAQATELSNMLKRAM
jgi:hypothetical protein